MNASFDAAQFIEPIELNGLSGRMLYAPARNKKNRDSHFLFVHGHHSAIERVQGVADLLMNYGNVAMPDLPGFGGMDHLYQIGEKPSIDNLADYMASFIRWKYGTKKRFVLVGYSMGFLVVTRLLQKYPHIQRQCVAVVSIAGMLKGTDLKLTTPRRTFYKLSSYIVGTRVVSFVAREIFMRKWFMASFYTRSHHGKDKFKNITTEKSRQLVDFEVYLWRVNHVPTWCYTAREMFHANLVDHQPKIHAPVFSVVVEGDRYFDNAAVAKNLKTVYSSVTTYVSDAESHGGGAVADAHDALPFMPAALRKKLSKLL